MHQSNKTLKKPAPPSASPTSEVEEVEEDVSPQELPDDRTVQEIIQASEQAIRSYPKSISTSFAYYLHELQRYPVLSPEAEFSLAYNASNGDQFALDALIRHNLRFVITVAQKYTSSGVLLEDLVQEGNVGLMKAAKRFDPSRGVKFISYAVYWINQTIRTGLANQQRSVRLPINRASQLAKIKRAETELSFAMDNKPSLEDISRATEIPVPRIKSLLRVDQPSLRIDFPHPQDPYSGALLKDRIAAEEDLEEEIELKLRSEEIEQALSHLKERDAQVLVLFYGLRGKREHTLEEIGVVLDITRERVRQLRARAEKELKKKGLLKAFKSYVVTENED